MKYFIFLVFLVNTHFLNAQTFEPPVIIDPPHPMVGDTIRIGIYTEYYPPCLRLPWQNYLGQTHLFETNGNHFDLTVVAWELPICNPLPFIVMREYYELGKLSEGMYSIQVYEVGDATPLPAPRNDPENFPFIPFGGTVDFAVTKPKVINTFSKISTTLLVLLLLLTSFFYKNFFYEKEHMIRR